MNVRKKIILNCNLPPGDTVLLTAAVRDLHHCYPKSFLTDVRSVCPELWENNPCLTPLTTDGQDVISLQCTYPLVNRSNTAPQHVIHGFIEFLNDGLDLSIKPTEFKGDIHLSGDETTWPSQVQELVEREIPFWIVMAGGKYDVTIKWWDARRYQQLVDHFQARIQFVQVGLKEHHHFDLDGVIDLRGQTSLRELIRLVYHSQGVLCPVTCAMHLAAAVPVKSGGPKNRPCVVIAGGREPSQWEAYPHHQFIHTNGALLCCDNGGCWKSRTVPLGDGNERDRPENLCVDVVGSLPRCMEMITADEVIQRIEGYFAGGAIRYLTPEKALAARRTVRIGNAVGWDRAQLERRLFRRAAERFIRTIPPCPGDADGRGIVICGGGPVYLPCAWVCIRMLRHLGCSLPIELWQLNDLEMTSAMKGQLSRWDVQCINAKSILDQHAGRVLHGWALKPYALLHSSFKEILYLDADNVPLVDPEFLFDTPQFGESGAIFWPDYGRLGSARSIWKICGVAYRDEPEFESGQIVVDQERCWNALSLAMWYNEHADFYYEHVYGDKETFHMAFRKVGQPYAMPGTPIHPLDGTMCQHDFDGRRIFQHRNYAKWRIDQPNRRIGGFINEDLCLSFLSELRPEWLPSADSTDTPSGPSPTNTPTGGQMAAFAPSDTMPTRIGTGSSNSERKGFAQKSDSARRQFAVAIDSIASVRPGGLKVLQIVPSQDAFCGVANFAQNLALAVRKQGVQVRNTNSLDGQDWADVILLHFESGLLAPGQVRGFRRGAMKPLILIAHSSGTERLASSVDGYIAMNGDVALPPRARLLRLDHPAFAPPVLSDRAALKAAYGLNSTPVVIGSSGLLLPHRQFDQIASMLAESAREDGWLISLVVAPHFTTPSQAVTELESLSRSHPDHFTFHFGFLPNWELNLRLQACDLLWCWSSHPSGGYASGVVSDMFASGSRIVAAKKKQHEHVLRLENVVSALAELEPFVSALVSEIRSGNFQRHDPAAVSWDRAAVRIVEYLQTFVRKRQPYAENGGWVA